MPRFQVPVPPLPTAVPLPSQYLSAPAAADGMANRIRALRDALLSKRPDNSLLCFSAFGRAAVIIFPNHWPRKACAQQNWSERVSISQIDRRGGVARQSERWMKRTERPSMADRAERKSTRLKSSH